jgi:cellulose biosynthesis protein BcsQ
LCFVSAKGGSGKTILAATAASILMKANQRVVTIDTDFSTRGLSLYLLDSLTNSRNPDIRPENCLADALLQNIPHDRIAPLVVPQKKGDFCVILPNSDFRLGGAPEDKLLRLGQAPRPSQKFDSPLNAGSYSPQDQSGEDFESRYLALLRALCERLRREFDYVIIDTRGGYDYSSKIPAVLADGYVVVIEADPISVQQVHGLKSRIDEFGEAVHIRPNHMGYIINKALFSPQEGSLFSTSLASLYGGKVFGTIPADRNAIGAYQTRDIPYQKYAGSDFAYYGFLALADLLSASSRLEGQARNEFDQLKRRIAGAWRTGRLLTLGEQAYPSVVLVMLALCLLSFFLYSNGVTWVRSQLVFGILIALMTLASAMPLVRVFADRRQSALRSLQSWIAPATITLICMSLFVTTARSIQRAVSSNALFQQALALQEIVTKLTSKSESATAEASRAAEQYKLVALERDSLKAQLQVAEARATTADSERARLQLALAAAQSQLAGLNSTWQANINWSINDSGPVECPSQFTEFKTGSQCVFGGGRKCLMAAAIDAAKHGDYKTAFNMAVVTQCHNPSAAETIRTAGPQAVGDYLRSK